MRKPARIDGQRARPDHAAHDGVERHVETLRHADQVARHRIDAAIDRDRGREEHAERNGRDLRLLADPEPEDQQRQQRDLRNREQRRDEGDADAARQRREPDREADDDAGRGAEQPADADAQRPKPTDAARARPTSRACRSRRAIADGAGRNSGLTQPALPASCQSAITSASAIQPRIAARAWREAGAAKCDRPRRFGRCADRRSARGQACWTSRSASIASSRISDHRSFCSASNLPRASIVAALGARHRDGRRSRGRGRAGATAPRCGRRAAPLPRDYA